MRRRAPRPCALVITSVSASTKQRHPLAAIGFNVHVTHSLLGGYAQAGQLLTPPALAQPVLILIDLHAAESGFPALTGTLLIAVLARHMRLGTISPAWLLGSAADPTPEQEVEALALGCQRIVRAPLTRDALLPLRELAATPPPIPHLGEPAEALRLSRVIRIRHSAYWNRCRRSSFPSGRPRMSRCSCIG